MSAMTSVSLMPSSYHGIVGITIRIARGTSHITLAHFPYYNPIFILIIFTRCLYRQCARSAVRWETGHAKKDGAGAQDIASRRHMASALVGASAPPHRRRRGRNAPPSQGRSGHPSEGGKGSSQAEAPCCDPTGERRR